MAVVYTYRNMLKYLDNYDHAMALEKCYLDNYDHAMALEKCYLDNYDHAMALEKCYLDNYAHAMALEKCYLDSIQVQIYMSVNIDHLTGRNMLISEWE